MVIVDVVIVVILVVALITGLMRGLLESLGTILGLVVGGALALWLLPVVSAWLPSPVLRGVVVLGLGVGLLVLGATLGSLVGATLRRPVDRTPLKGIERFLGGIASVVVASLAIVLVAPTIALSGIPAVSAAIGSSRVLQAIDTMTPAPLDEGIAQLRSALMGGGLPQLKELLGPSSGISTSPPVSLSDPQLERAAASVARITGIAYACGTGMTGSGFVVAPDRVITNAHVVAGVETPIVELPGRSAQEGRIVYYDPVHDLAVIAVDHLAAPALKLVPTVSPGTSAAVEGYPNGGPFSVVPATVLAVGTVPVPNVYDTGAAPREIYALKALVRPGNSGGPLLTGAGDVAGLVFARGVDDTSRGYAITSSQLQPVVTEAPRLQSAVSSGHCTS